MLSASSERNPSRRLSRLFLFPPPVSSTSTHQPSIVAKASRSESRSPPVWSLALTRTRQRVAIHHRRPRPHLRLLLHHRGPVRRLHQHLGAPSAATCGALRSTVPWSVLKPAISKAIHDEIQCRVGYGRHPFPVRTKHRQTRQICGHGISRTTLSLARPCRPLVQETKGP